jgi:hypothetical protein
MGLFSWLGGLFDDDNGSMDTDTTINPASGLPMISGDTSGVDVDGNPYGMDDSDDFNNNSDSFINSDSDFGSSDMFSNNSDFCNDSFSNDSFSSFGNNDTFGSGSSGFGDDF